MTSRMQTPAVFVESNVDIICFFHKKHFRKKDNGTNIKLESSAKFVYLMIVQALFVNLLFCWSCPKWNTNETMQRKSSCPNKWYHQNTFILFDLNQLLLYCIHLTFLVWEHTSTVQAIKRGKIKATQLSSETIIKHLSKIPPQRWKIRPPRYKYVQWFVHFVPLRSLVMYAVTNGIFPVQEVDDQYPNPNWVHQRQSRKLFTQFKPMVNVSILHLKQQLK